MRHAQEQSARSERIRSWSLALCNKIRSMGGTCALTFKLSGDSNRYLVTDKDAEESALVELSKTMISCVSALPITKRRKVVRLLRAALQETLNKPQQFAPDGAERETDK